MKIFTTRATLSDYLRSEVAQHKTIGFVPTMGALHQGHLSLIENAGQQNDLVVCSIFVNPTQFNDPKDLEKYPRPIESDISKLEKTSCNVLFLPSVAEMYQEGEQWHIDLGEVENKLEGKMRPGHYQGVTQIVKKLFDIVQPNRAYFGQKDYQQFLVVDQMVKHFKLEVKLVMCPIIREADGLAMSSRNVHLSPQEHKEALALNRALKQAQSNFHKKSITENRAEVIQFLNSSEGVELEYFEICDGMTLEPVTSIQMQPIVALVAAKVGHTRLIDNVILR
ncbi:MAG TPA: pantoate--beta-alanine ligase [Daejeonella sp.]|nr:pantoate--beta-alanine ligase [Daejeonella sp.]